MRKNYVRTVGIFLAAAALWGCGSDKKTLTLSEAEKEVPAEAVPEEVKGRLDVYTSMARAVKYNINATRQNMKSKVEPGDPKLSARDLIRSVLNVKAGQESQLYDALRVLDFAAIFAENSLENNPAAQEDYLFAKSSQHLALAAIKAHEDALFGLKKIKEIDRESKKELKILEALKQKMERNGKLSDADIEYKKGIEVALLEQNQVRNTLLNNVAQYARLVRSDDQKITLEGRRFYELDDFDRNFTMETFQRTAAANRSELLQAKRNGYNNEFAAIQNKVMQNYPEVEHLQINGYDIKDPLYADGLVRRAMKVSENLLISAMDYRKENNPNRKKAYRDVVYQDLGTAVFAQVELAYNLVNLTSLDLQTVRERIAKQRKEIRTKEKGFRGGYKDKLEVLNLKNKLLANEMQESQVLAERAVALRSLYFYAGFSPFSEVLLGQDIKVINENLKIAFNQDLVSMLSSSPKKESRGWSVKDEDWAKGENWLEQLVEEKKQLGGGHALDGRVPEIKKTAAVAQKAAATAAATAKAVDVDYNKRKVLQLGAYLQKENADLEWKMLRQLYPELQNVTPKIERAHVNGQVWYRLIVESADGGWADLCERLKNDRFGCILR